MTFVSPPSIQDFRVPPGLAHPADRYFRWVDEQVPGVRVQRLDERVAMHLWGSRRPAILLEPSGRDDGVEAFRVIGGFMVARPPGGEFRFESIESGRLRIVLCGFRPRLPKLLFMLTHSLVHEAVMWWFQRHVEVPLIEESR